MYTPVDAAARSPLPRVCHGARRCSARAGATAVCSGSARMPCRGPPRTRATYGGAAQALIDPCGYQCGYQCARRNMRNPHTTHEHKQPLGRHTQLQKGRAHETGPHPRNQHAYTHRRMPTKNTAFTHSMRTHAPARFRQTRGPARASGVARTHDRPAGVPVVSFDLILI
jgi:hypothetical protein